MKITFKVRTDFCGMRGYLDFVCSIQRRWKGDSTGRTTWRHVTLGLRSPVCRQPGKLYSDGRARYTWHHLRFGYGGGNVYLGVIYIITTFGSSHPPLAYAKWGPFEWARQPTMAQYLARGRRA